MLEMWEDGSLVNIAPQSSMALLRSTAQDRNHLYCGLWLKIIIKLPFSLAWSSLCLSYVTMTVDAADVVTAQPLMFVA